MALLGTLKDGFDDGTINTSLWTGNYGDLIESGGRIRIPCTPGYAGLKSATAYTLTGSHILLRAYPPAPGGAASAAMSILVLSSVGGTDAGFIVDRAQNAIGLWLREGYADAGALFPAYDPAAHAWLRLRESGGSLLWEASPNGTAWTTLRTATTPAWAASTDLAFLIESHRDVGTDDYAEADYVNLPPVAVALGTAQETAAAQAVARRKARSTGIALETSTALTPARFKRLALGFASTTDNALPAGRGKSRLLGSASSIETAAAPGRTKTVQLDTAQERDLAMSVDAGTIVDLGFTIGEPALGWEVGTPWL